VVCSINKSSSTISERPPTPRDVFERFQEGLSKSNIQEYGCEEPWTKYATEFFREWGQNLGYESCCREAYGGTGEYMSIDVIWIKKAADQRFIDLAMEHENNIDEAFDDELQKLMDVKALLKVLITYSKKKDKRERFVAKVAWGIRMRALKLSEERYLLIIGSPPEDKKPSQPYVQIQGFVFDNTGCLIDNFSSPIICTKPTVSQT